MAFDYAGYGGRAAILDGQWKRWKAENRPVTAEKPAVTASTRAPKPRPDVVARLDKMRDYPDKAENAGNARNAEKVKRVGEAGEVGKAGEVIGAGKAGASVSLVDARSDAQYKGEQKQDGIARPGHIPGAQCIFWQRNIVSQENPVMRPVDELHQLYASAGLDPKNEVVTYCTTGGQASFEYFALRYLEYSVRFYDGSYEEWNAAPGTRVETTAR